MLSAARTALLAPAEVAAIDIEGNRWSRRPDTDIDWAVRRVGILQSHPLHAPDGKR